MYKRGIHVVVCILLEMANRPGSVVLIFREIEPRWRDEHPLNLLAAWATRSKYSHVELSIGDEAGHHGEIGNVLRIFNDNVGVEVAQRTGRSPAFQYVQLGCSLASEHAMLQWAHNQIGKPFSMTAMARSIIWPRKSNTQNSSWFCAELVAAALQVGGLLSKSFNPGAATPANLYTHFISQATTTGNPCTMRSLHYAPGASSIAPLGASKRSGALGVGDELKPLIPPKSSVMCNITLGGTLHSPSNSYASRPQRPPPSAPPVAPSLPKPANATRVACSQTGFQLNPISSRPMTQSAPMAPIMRPLPRAAVHSLPHPTNQPHQRTGLGVSQAETAIREAVRRANVHTPAREHVAQQYQNSITSYRM